MTKLIWTMKLTILNSQETNMDFDALEQAINKHVSSVATVETQQVLDGELNVIFADEDLMIELNQKYRKKSYLTDVLSFSYLESRNEQEKLLGEIYISLKKAKSQAEQKGNDLETEINYLIIHGYLHIFGFRHDTDKQEAEMNKEEDWILAEISDKLVIR